MGRTLWRASPENFPDPCHSGTRYSRHQAHNFFSRMTLSWARRLVVGPDDSPCPTGTSSTNPPAPQHDGSTAQPCAVTKNSSSRNALALSWPSPVRRDKNVHPHLELLQESHHRWVKIAPISRWMGSAPIHVRPCSRAKAGIRGRRDARPNRLEQPHSLGEEMGGKRGTQTIRYCLFWGRSNHGPKCDMGPPSLAQVTVRSWGRGTRPRPQLMHPSSTQASDHP